MQTESLHALEDFVSALGPTERFGGFVAMRRRVREERRAQFVHAAVDTTTQLPFVSSENQVSTWFNQELEVGVKCK
jgi:hypothetical protein